MKKTSIILSAIAAVLVAVAFGLLFFVGGSYMPYGFKGSGMEYWSSMRLEFFNFKNIAGTYGNYPIMWVFLAVFVLIIVLWIFHLIRMFVRHRGNSWFQDIAFLGAGMLGLDLAIYGFLPGIWGADSVGATAADHSALVTAFENGTFKTGTYVNIFTVLGSADIGAKILGALPYIFGGVAVILLLVAVILSLVDMRKNPGAKKKKSMVPAKDAKAATEANPAPAAATKPSDDESYRQTLNEELNETPEGTNATVTGQSYQGPQPGIIQYINYGAGKGAKPMDNNNYVTKDELGKIIHEELGEYFKKSEKEDGEAVASDSGNMLTSDDLRQIIREEMGTSVPAPVTPVQEGMKASEIRQLIAEEIAKALAAEREADAKAEEEREAKRQEALATEKLERENSEKLRDARVQELVSQVRASNGEIAKLKDSAITTEQIRTVVAQELDRKFPDGYVVKTAAQPVAPAPAPAPVVVAPVAPAPAPAPAPVPAPAPLPEPNKIIRIPFANRMTDAEKDLKNNYNELKAEALSYGLKSRISNSGDTFRLHTKTYLKITIAGKGLKIYYAVDPKDYANGPIPVKDASNKNIYKEIPGCFKVKSDLSVNRAKQLIADACGKDKLAQEQVEPHNFAAELKDYKPQGADDDDEVDEDDKD